MSSAPTTVARAGWALILQPEVKLCDFGTPQRSVSVGKVELSNDRPLAIIGGVNVLESRELAVAMCDIFREMTRDLGMPYIFKGSFDKANRSSGHSYRGPGLEKGLKILDEVKWRYNVPIITDVHEASQVAPVAEVADVPATAGLSIAADRPRARLGAEPKTGQY